MRFPTCALQRHRTCLALIAALLITSCAFFISLSTSPYPFNVPRSYGVDPVPRRRDLARKILKIQRQIEFQAAFDNKVDAAWSEGLMAVISELDPRVTIFEKEATNQHQQQGTEASRDLSTAEPPPNVCPEIYKGRDYDFSLETNFQEDKCNAKKFKDVITVLIVAKGWTFQRLEFVVQNFRKHYDAEVVVLAFEKPPKSIDSEEVIVKVFDAETSEASALNDVVPLINTPYTLIAHSLTHFNGHSPLERLVRVLDNIELAAVASGAYRDIKGYWNHGCLQTRAENYKVKYMRGYEHSYHECMYCDDVLGPFVAETEFLKRVPMTENMNGPALYRDWFLNIRLTGKLVVSCPDVMFFIETEPIMTMSDWHTISQKWSLQRIFTFDGKEIKISCEDAQISCTNLMKTVSSFLVPPCCREKIREELGYVQDCARELGVYYELQAGTLLGAVKMDGILPWDFDTDVLTDCVDQETWMTKGFKCMSKKGCTSKLQSGNYWTSSCKQSTIDITCRYNRTTTLPVEYQQVATQADLDGKWIQVTSNPGRTSRNRYGPEYLKHAVHWRYLSSNNSSPPKDEVPAVTGLWSNCAEPSFHSCLDHFPVDGNIRFKSSVCSSP